MHERSSPPAQRPLRLVYLTAGAGGMYCGSCIHDNRLARTLLDLGHDVRLVPIYTPIRTDETDVTVDRVFFGGINIYLQQKIPVFRHLPGLIGRFLDQPWLIRKVTARAIETDARFLGEMTVSMLRGPRGFQRTEVHRLGRWLAQSEPPDLLLLSNLLIGGGIPMWKKQLRVPVAVLLQGDDVFLDYLPTPFRQQALDLMIELAAHVDLFLVHSQFYAEAMAELLGIDRQRMAVVPLGIDPSDFAMPSPLPAAEGRTIGYLSRLAPEKGLQHLVNAFVLLKADARFADVRLEIAGWLGPSHQAFADDLFHRLDRAGLAGQWRYLGAVDHAEKIAFLNRIDLFSVPADFREPKGLYALEAMAAGVPLVAPDHGVFSELLRASGGGWLCTPRDAAALARTLAEALQDEPARRAAGERGRDFAVKHRHAVATAQQTVAILESVRAAHQAG